MNDKIKRSYRASKNIYDDVMTQGTWWSRLYNRVFWGGVDDHEIARLLLDELPADFEGRLLDVPAGTAVFTWRKYQAMARAGITCLDYSEDMLAQAEERFRRAGLRHVTTVQGDVGRLPFADGQFDVVLSMNGFHAFPDKDRAFDEVFRVLKPGGRLLACFYVRGESRVTDWLVNAVLSRKGWFTPPFDTVTSLRRRLTERCQMESFHIEGAVVCFSAKKI